MLDRAMPLARNGIGMPPHPLPELPQPGFVPHGRVLGVGMAELLGNRSFAAILESKAGNDIRRGIPAHVAVHGLPDKRDWRDIQKLVSEWSIAASPLFALQFPDGVRPGTLGRADSIASIRIYLRTDRRRTLAAAEWQRMQRCRRIYPFYGLAIRSVCPLLADEPARELLPGCGLLVPPGSAWIPLPINLANFANGCGTVDRQLLTAALVRSLHAAENVLDQSDWVCSKQRDDAPINRRIAIFLNGIGDLVVRGKRDPQALDTLKFLQQLLAEIRDTLVTTSRKIAARAGLVPALNRDPRWESWSSDAAVQNWKQCYREACQQSGTRHRNLLAMSPYSILPTQCVASPAFADLLPLLSSADAWCFSGGDICHHWSAVDAHRFHERARAVINGTTTQGRIAGGV